MSEDGDYRCLRGKLVQILGLERDRNADSDIAGNGNITRGVLLSDSRIDERCQSGQGRSTVLWQYWDDD